MEIYPPIYDVYNITEKENPLYPSFE